MCISWENVVLMLKAEVFLLKAGEEAEVKLKNKLLAKLLMWVKHEQLKIGKLKWKTSLKLAKNMSTQSKYLAERAKKFKYYHEVA